MKASDLTHTRLFGLIEYDKDLGIFYRRASRFPAQIGKETGSLDAVGYVRIHIDGVNHLAHRLAWFYIHGAWPLGPIDHRDGNRSNNVFSNLRDATMRINAENQRGANSRSIVGVLGVSHSGKTRYRAQIVAQLAGFKVRMYLGTYDTAEDAHAVYLALKRKLHNGCTI